MLPLIRSLTSDCAADIAAAAVSGVESFGSCLGSWYSDACSLKFESSSAEEKMKVFH